MKKYLLSAFIILLSLSLHAQKDETIFGHSGIRLTGIWGGATTHVNGFEEDFDLLGGGYFAFELNKALLLGWSDSEMNARFEGDRLKFRTRNFLLGYSPISYRSFHPFFYTAIGSGLADYETEGKDRMLNIEPTLSLELNVLRWFRLSLDGGYRFVSGSDFTTVTDKMLSGPFVGLRLKFGWSWGR